MTGLGAQNDTTPTPPGSVDGDGSTLSDVWTRDSHPPDEHDFDGTPDRGSSRGLASLNSGRRHRRRGGGRRRGTGRNEGRPPYGTPARRPLFDGGLPPRFPTQSDRTPHLPTGTPFRPGPSGTPVVRTPVLQDPGGERTRPTGRVSSTVFRRPGSPLLPDPCGTRRTDTPSTTPSRDPVSLDRGETLRADGTPWVPTRPPDSDP